MIPRYIALEGIEGSGKTVQAALLAQHISGRLTREDGGTDVGVMIRQITHLRTHEVDPWCEALLFAADRAQHVSEVIEPALAFGRHVVSDRSVWSSVAYQGGGRQLGPVQIYDMNKLATRGCMPEIVLYLDIDLETMKARRGHHLDRIEAEGDAFFERVIETYELLPRMAVCDAWIVIDAKAPLDEVTAKIFSIIDGFLAEECM